MKIFEAFNLRKRVIFGFGIVLICFVGALIYGIYGLNSNSAQLEHMVEVAKEVRIANSINENFLNSIIAFKSHIDTGDEKSVLEFDENYLLLKENISTLKTLADNNLSKEEVDQISEDMNVLNERFSQVKYLNEQLSKDYITVAETGYRMLDELEVIESYVSNGESAGIYREVRESIEYLLFARLHSAKFIDFRTELEYDNYQEKYNLFVNSINRLEIISDVEPFLEEFITLESDMEIYSDGMNRLYNNILDIDNNLKEVEEIYPRVNLLVKSIVNSLETELSDTQTRGTNNNDKYNISMIILSILAICLSIFVGVKILDQVLQPINYLSTAFRELSEGETNTDFRLKVVSHDEIGEMSDLFNLFMVKLGELISEVELSNYIHTADSDMTGLVRDEMNIKSVAESLLTYVTNYTKGVMGSFYILEEYEFVNYASFAHVIKNEDKNFELGESYLGEVAKSGKVSVIDDLDNIALSSNFKLKTSVIDKTVIALVIIPCTFEGHVNGVVELGYMHKISKNQILLFTALGKNIGALINSAKTRIKMKALLDKTLVQTVELQTQQEELRVSNEELEERSKQLEEQKTDLSIKNSAIMNSREEVLYKAKELELVNKYKTEFLANMSHELRTPLNSILVLSQLLEERNNIEPLTSKEIEFAKTINRSGNDLLTLINGVLDLSKVEAGKLDLCVEEISLKDFIRDNVELFEKVAEVKNINFLVENQIEQELVLKTDRLRINQIAKNLISNAIKFTHKGSVKLIIRKPYQSEINRFERQGIHDIVFEVKDTGIGIAKDKQKMIFEAFKQTDGSTARSYGGTGLGLTIALQLAELLKGTIYVESSEGEGSTFALITPIDLTLDEKVVLRNSNEKKLKDTLLIIEDDVDYANILKDICSDKGYTTYISHTGYEGISKAKELLPNGIILDIGLPDIDGMEVAKILEKTKETSGIPIHIISGDDADISSNVPKSIIGFIKKPIDIKAIYQTLAKIQAYSNSGLKKLLVVGSCGGEDFELFKNLGQIEVSKISSGGEAISLLSSNDYGCIVLDTQLEDMRGIEFLGIVSRKTNEKIPIIIYTENEIETKEYNQMKEFTSNIILKSSKSKDRLTDEVNLFLHDMKSSMNQNSRQEPIAKDKIVKEDSLVGKRVLVVDDDDRNVFALTHALEQRGMNIIAAEDGRKALERFENESVDIVLMDVMMPDMDGYEATRKIRQLKKGKDIPIIALTAKAMKEDREKCIKAGASDYMTKPIEINKLTSLLKVWLS